LAFPLPLTYIYIYIYYQRTFWINIVFFNIIPSSLLHLNSFPLIGQSHIATSWTKVLPVNTKYNSCFSLPPLISKHKSPRSVSHSLFQFAFLPSKLPLLMSPCVISTLLFISFASSSLARSAKYSVLSYGAKPDGKTDSTKAFAAAWSQACASTKPATLYVPKGIFSLGQVIFQGPCKNNAILVSVAGSLVAPSDYGLIGGAKNWLVFEHVNGVTLSGGTLDGQGAGLWSCKKSGKSCPSGATVR